MRMLNAIDTATEVLPSSSEKQTGVVTNYRPSKYYWPPVNEVDFPATG